MRSGLSLKLNPMRVIPVSVTNPNPAPSPSSSATRRLLWVDGGGAILVFLQNHIRMGRYGGDADLKFMAPLSNCHATLFHTGESHVLVPEKPVTISGRSCVGPTLLRNGEVCELAPNVRFEFQESSPLSRTAVLSFPGKVSPTPTLDRAILMQRTCLIGKSSQSHILIPGVEESGILIWDGKELICRFALDPGENGIESIWGDGQKVVPGATIAGRQIRFRCETSDART